jgi:hypothetical protein
MNLDLIAPEVIQRLPDLFFIFVWQGAVIALLTAAGFGFCASIRRSPLRVRDRSLVCMLAAPFVTLAFYSQTGAIAERLILALNLASVEVRTAPASLRLLVGAADLSGVVCGRHCLRDAIDRGLASLVAPGSLGGRDSRFRAS